MLTVLAIAAAGGPPSGKKGGGKASGGKASGKKRTAAVSHADDPEYAALDAKGKRAFTLAKKKEAAAAAASGAGGEPEGEETPPTKAPKGSKGRGRKRGAEVLEEEDAVLAGSEFAEDAQSDRDGADSDGPGSSKKKPRGMNKKQKKAETALLNGPFAGKVRLQRGDDLNQLRLRSMAPPTAEMTADREFIWKMCERCAAHLEDGTYQ